MDTAITDNKTVDTAAGAGTSSTQAAKPAEEKKNQLGISRGIYAAGYAFKDAAIWFVAITGALATLIAYGQKQPPEKTLHKFTQKIMNSPGWIGKMIKSGVEYIPIVGKPIANAASAVASWLNGPIIATSIGMGWLLSHAAMGPGSALGWKKAQKAIDQYDAVAQRSARLAEANLGLQEENKQLKAQLAGSDKGRNASFVEAERLREQTAAQQPSGGIGAA